MRRAGNREQETGSRVQKLKYVGALCAVAGASLLAGCRQDMHDQPKFFPQRGTSFYADGRSVRPQVENTIARGQMREDAYFYTGMTAGKEGDGLPFAATREVLERGQERFNVYCTPCHSRVGNGTGMIVQRGYRPAGDFHTARLLAAPLGHFFNVMTNGFGAMPDYAAQLTPADRWAVAAYIRALQLSQNAKQTDVPMGVRPKSLTEIARDEGLIDKNGELPPGYAASQFGLPSTAIYGTPNNQDNGIPGQPAGTQPAKPAGAAASNNAVKQ